MVVDDESEVFFPGLLPQPDVVEGIQSSGRHVPRLEVKLLKYQTIATTSVVIMKEA